MTGLFLACLFSAILSTVSTGLNSISAVALSIIKGLHSKDISDRRCTQISKLICLLIEIGSGYLCVEAIFFLFFSLKGVLSGFVCLLIAYLAAILNVKSLQVFSSVHIRI